MDGATGPSWRAEPPRSSPTSCEYHGAHGRDPPRASDQPAPRGPQPGARAGRAAIEGERDLLRAGAHSQSPSRHEQTARVHLSLSGTLHKTLSSRAFSSASRHREVRISSSPASGRRRLGFSMALIPMSRQRRYQYVILDSEHVHPLTSMRWEELRSPPPRAARSRADRGPLPRRIQRARVGNTGRVVPLRSARPHLAPRLPDARHHGDRQRQRQMVPHHHTWQRLLNRLPHPAHRPDTRRSGRRGAADRAETSCNFYWAAAWVHRCHQDLDCTLEHLEQAPGQLA
jgi:hypothetical protein